MSQNNCGSFRSESPLMSVARTIGSEALAWALRRYHCPVDRNALVLEVGSGGNPYGRANVLLDAYESTRERHWAPLSADRPTVLGFVENLPFRDKAFDFVIAAHVLEHSSDPERFLAELQRVAHAGYIEVPDALMERINPYRDHRLEITTRDGVLLIRKKIAWRHDAEVVDLYEDRVKSILTRVLIPKHPFAFHVRHYWRDRIIFNVLNPEVDAGWAPPESDCAAPTVPAGGVRAWLRDVLRGAVSQRRRNASIDLMPLLRCTVCGGTDLARETETIHCGGCGTRFLVRRGIPVMNEPLTAA